MALLYFYIFHDPEGEEAGFYAAELGEAKKKYEEFYKVDKAPALIRRERW